MAPAASAPALPPGYQAVKARDRVRLIRPPASLADAGLVHVGARLTAAARRRGVYAIRVYRVHPDGHHPYRHNTVLINILRHPYHGGWVQANLRGPSSVDFAVRYDLLLRPPGSRRHHVLYQVAVAR